jgi:hypothetical protein
MPSSGFQIEVLQDNAIFRAVRGVSPPKHIAILTSCSLIGSASIVVLDHLVEALAAAGGWRSEHRRRLRILRIERR